MTRYFIRICLLLFSICIAGEKTNGQAIRRMDMNGKILPEEKQYRWAELGTQNFADSVRLQTEENICKTYVYRSSLNAPAGGQISAVGTIALTNNSIIAAVSVKQSDGSIHSNLVHIGQDGSILKQVRLDIEGVSAKIMSIVPEDGNGFLVAGVLSNQPSTLFLARITMGLAPSKVVTWEGTGPISNIFMYALSGRPISIAAETDQHHLLYLLSPVFNVSWSVRINRKAGEDLKGVFYSPTNIVTIGRTKVPSNNQFGYEVFEFNLENGASIQGWETPDNKKGEVLYQFTGSDNRIGVLGVYKAANGKWQVWRKSIGEMSRTFNDWLYEFDQSLEADVTMKASIALDAVAICNGATGQLYFVFQNLHNDFGPTRSRDISVPLGARIQSIRRTADAGFLFALDKDGGNEVWFIKTDSSGVLGNCETKDTKIGFIRNEGTIFNAIGNNAEKFIIQNKISTAITLNANLQNQITCKQNYCPPQPIEDTCSEGFLKLLKGYFWGNGVHSGLIQEEKIFTNGWAIENYSSPGGINTGIIGQYSINGYFEKATAVFVNGQSTLSILWPGNGDTLYMSTTTARNDSLFFNITALNSIDNVIWSNTILTYYRINQFHIAPQVTDIIRDFDGGVFVVFNQPNLSAAHRHIGVIKFSRLGKFEWERVFQPRGSSFGSAVGAAGSAGFLLLCESANPGSFTILIDRKSGEILATHSFDNNTSYSTVATDEYKLFYYNGKFYYVSLISQNDDTKILAAILNKDGKAEKMVVFNEPHSRLASSFSKGIFDIFSTQYNAATQRLYIQKIQLNDKLELIHSVGLDIGETFMIPIKIMHTANGTPMSLGYHISSNDPLSSDNFLAKYNPSGSWGNCLTWDIPQQPIEFSPKERVVNIDKSSESCSEFPTFQVVLQPFEYGINISDILCKQDVLCTEIKVAGPDKVCQLGEIQEFIAKRNNGCTYAPQWLLSGPNAEVVSRKDDTLKVRFLERGVYSINARMPAGCEVLEDSFKVFVSPAVNTINLGPDTTLCPGDSMLLKAGAGFPGYQWSTGGTDSTLWVSAAGKYFVKVENTCGAPLSDTIEVFMPAVPVLSAGADSSVCMGQPFQRSASDGFASYQWRDISSQQIVSGQKQLSVTAMAGTSYAIEAVTDIGCKRYDTLTLQVISARPFDLGNHVNICMGDTVVFSAPADYAAYFWNTGETTTELKAWQQGIYKLTVTDNNGCKASDSTAITTVFALPQPALGPDQSVCAGSSILLNPGTFARYQWQNASTQSSFIASANGMYAVQVWDANGCTAADTMQILAQLPLPTGFLAPTDSICQYEKLELKPIAGYRTYLWSTGSIQPAIQVDKPGIYALKVTDNNNCTGTDTMRVIQKICMEGVYVPNAFTPNNDRINDVFRPMVFGIAIRYEFSVYNRFGERMFVTNDVLKGWDGMYKGQPMPANAYAWMCTYHLEGGEAKVERGMVTLIR